MKPPSNAATNGWYNVLPDPPPARRPEGSVRVPWAVVGAGFTGLAAARRLAEHYPDQPIALIEAERVGFGTSGRNSGFVLDFHFMPYQLPFPDQALAEARKRLSSGGLAILCDLVQANQIACQWRQWGKLWVAAGSAGEKGLDEQRRGNDSLGASHTDLDAGEIARITGSGFYTGGVKVEGTALVNPAALCRGLVQTLPGNVTVYEDSPVLRHRRGRPHRLETANGEVVTDQVLLCTNVFSPSLCVGGSAMVALSIFASITRPMTDEEKSAMGGDGSHFGLLPSCMGGSTLQHTPDGRIVMRNSGYYGPGGTSDTAFMEHVRRIHAESIAKRWPQLAELDIEHTWGGCVAITRNEGHIFGRLGDGMWGSIGCNGAGVSNGTMAGTLLADHIAGQDSDLLSDQMRIPAPAWIPPEPIRGFIGRRRIRRNTVDTTER
ncbi:MAG: FAD-binding oxidoreductase [Rhodospirillales bacterium]|nr:FAD-binding oxidoreductase [Rhodospirillales bacterium]